MCRVMINDHLHDFLSCLYQFELLMWMNLAFPLRTKQPNINVENSVFDVSFTCSRIVRDRWMTDVFSSWPRTMYVNWNSWLCAFQHDRLKCVWCCVNQQQWVAFFAWHKQTVNLLDRSKSHQVTIQYSSTPIIYSFIVWDMSDGYTKAKFVCVKNSIIINQVLNDWTPRTNVEHRALTNNLCVHKTRVKSRSPRLQ